MNKTEDQAVLRAMANFRFGGVSLKTQGIIVTPTNGGAKPTVAVIPERYYWNRPFSRQRDRGERYDHDGNGCQMSGPALPNPERAMLKTMGNATKSDLGRGGV